MTDKERIAGGDDESGCYCYVKRQGTRRKGREASEELQEEAAAQAKRIAELEALVNDLAGHIREAETELATAHKTRTLAQAEANRQLERARQAEADRARLRKALEAAKPALEAFCITNPKWQYGKGRQDPCGGHAALSMVGAALSGAGEREHPDTVKLRAVMSWLDERDRAYPADVDIFRSLTEENQRFANMALRSVGVVRDRLSADISRLWCSQLREVIDALKEVERG